VLIPIFILKGTMVCAPFWLTLCSTCFYSFRRATRWSKDKGLFCLIALAIMVVVLAPLLTFEILLAKRAEAEAQDPSAKQMAYALIFIPLFIMEGCAFVGCIILNITAIVAD